MCYVSILLIFLLPCYSFNFFSASSSHIEWAEKLTIALSDLYRSMESNQTIAPHALLQVLHQAFPRFADKVEGHYMQQVN